MNYILDHTGKPYYRFFEEISAIPRLSFQEKAISDYIVRFAQERGLWCYQDELWNVVVKKPASPGYENHEPIMIQGHTDMVGEKTPGSAHDFEKDPLELYVEDGWLKAKDTTLGADCGHGIAYMLAILDDDTLKHPPLEMFFSVQEEAGIGGPRFMDYTKLSSKKLINTDQMFEGATYVSCSNVVGGYFLQEESLGIVTGTAFELKVAGLYGGHAAMNIYRDQANAIKLAARVMYGILKTADVRIERFRGGTIKNNIAEECVVRFLCNKPECDLREIVQGIAEAARDEYGETDPNLWMELCSCGQETAVAADPASSRQMVELLCALPTGACHRSIKIENFVWTSRNLGTVFLDCDAKLLRVGFMFRSGRWSHIDMLLDEIFLVASHFNAHYDEEYRYYGYTIDPERSPLTQMYKALWEKMYGTEFRYLYIHGGTDAGTIMHGMNGMDVLSIGPNTVEFHRPGERLELASFDKTYRCLVALLEKL